ncbi:DUF1049 domain-containing protein [soil metagenome]
MSTDPTGPPEPSDPDPPANPGSDKSLPPESAVQFTRAAALWGALIFGFLILIVLLIFIAQNTESAQFAFLGWHWSLPLGVAILFAAVAGGLLTVAVGAVRIFQLRRAAKKNLRAGW